MHPTLVLYFTVTVSMLAFSQTDAERRWLVKNNIKTITLYNQQYHKSYVFNQNGQLIECAKLDTVNQVVREKEVYNNGVLVTRINKYYDKGVIHDSTISILEYDDQRRLIKASTRSFVRLVQNDSLVQTDSSLSVYTYRKEFIKIEQFQYIWDTDEYLADVKINYTDKSGLDSLEIRIDLSNGLDTIGVKEFKYKGRSSYQTIEFHDNTYFQGSSGSFWIYREYDIDKIGDSKIRTQRRYFGTNDQQGLVEEIRWKYRFDGSPLNRTVTNATGKVIESRHFPRMKKNVKNAYKFWIEQSQRNGTPYRITYFHKNPK